MGDVHVVPPNHESVSGAVEKFCVVSVSLHVLLFLNTRIVPGIIVLSASKLYKKNEMTEIVQKVLEEFIRKLIY